MKHLPNLLTILRLLLVPCFIGASMQRMYIAAFVIFVSAAMTDIFDGALARRLNLRSRLGAILDPLADKALMVCGFLYFTFAGNLPAVRIPGWLTFAVFIRDFLIIVFAYLMYTRVQVKRFPPSVAGKTSTLSQAFTLGAVIAGNSGAAWAVSLSQVLFRVSLVLALASGWGYLRRARRVLDELGTDFAHGQTLPLSSPR